MVSLPKRFYPEKKLLSTNASIKCIKKWHSSRIMLFCSFSKSEGNSWKTSHFFPSLSPSPTVVFSLGRRRRRGRRFASLIAIENFFLPFFLLALPVYKAKKMEGGKRRPRLGVTSYDEDVVATNQHNGGVGKNAVAASMAQQDVFNRRRPPRTSASSKAFNRSMPDDDGGVMSEAETSSTTRAVPNAHRRRNKSHHHGGHGHHHHPPPSASVNRKSRRETPPGEDDAGIMSEAETASTSSRIRMKKHHSITKPSLPVVRTHSKTLERPLGVVFLIYRGETRRALLPNEITSLITVKALFVRSFNKELTLDYMDSPRVKIYIHDNDEDKFNSLLEDELDAIRDRTILKVFEMDSSGKGPEGLGSSGLPPIVNADEFGGYNNSGGNSGGANEDRRQQSGLPYNSTLPRNAFSSLEPYQAANNGNNTLGPNFGRAFSLPQQQRRVESGYVSSPDGHFEFDQQQQQQQQQQQRQRRVPPHSSRYTSESAHPSRYYPG